MAAWWILLINAIEPGGTPSDGFEPLDHDDFPQRFVAGHGLAELPGHERRELFPTARLGELGALDVAVDVEVFVLDPVGVAELERHFDQALGERAAGVDPRGQQIPQLVEIEGTGGGFGLDDRQTPDMHRGIGCLEVEEGGVEPRQLLWHPKLRRSARGRAAGRRQRPRRGRCSTIVPRAANRAAA